MDNLTTPDGAGDAADITANAAVKRVTAANRVRAVFKKDPTSAIMLTLALTGLTTLGGATVWGDIAHPVVTAQVRCASVVKLPAASVVPSGRGWKVTSGTEFVAGVDVHIAGDPAAQPEFGVQYGAQPSNSWVDAWYQPVGRSGALPAGSTTRFAVSEPDSGRPSWLVVTTRRTLPVLGEAPFSNLTVTVPVPRSAPACPVVH